MRALAFCVLLALLAVAAADCGAEPVCSASGECNAGNCLCDADHTGKYCDMRWDAYNWFLRPWRVVFMVLQCALSLATFWRLVSVSAIKYSLHGARSMLDLQFVTLLLFGCGGLPRAVYFVDPTGSAHVLEVCAFANCALRCCACCCLREHRCPLHFSLTHGCAVCCFHGL